MAQPIHPHSHVMRGIVLRFTAGLAFGLMIALLKLSANLGAGLGEIIFYRSAIGLIPVLVWILPRDGLAGLMPRQPKVLLPRNALGIVAMLLSFQGLILLPLAESTTIGFTSPILATLLSALILHERVGRHRWLAGLICFAGVIVVMRPGADGDAIAPLGVALALGGALFAASATIAIRHMAGTESVGAIAFWFMFGCMLVGALLMPFTGTSSGWEVVAILAGAGLLGGVGQLLMTASLHSAPVSALAPFDYLQLIYAALLGWLIIGTVPTLYTWTGAALISVGGLYIVWRERQLHREREVPATQPLI